MKSINPSEVRGKVIAPPSKSMAVRAIAAASLVTGEVTIHRTSHCDDALSASRVIEAMGSKITGKGDTLIIRSGLTKSSGKRVLDCGESGLCMRMFAPIAALTAEETILVASGSLRARPMEMVEKLRTLHAYCATDNGCAPIMIKGPLKGGSIHIDAAVTSQFLTGLLMALPVCGEPSTIFASHLKSAPYVRMTVSLLEHFGIMIEHDEDCAVFSIPGRQAYRGTAYKVEGDWSAAAFLLVAGAIAGNVLVRGLDPFSFQADKAVVGALAEAGAGIVMGKDWLQAQRKVLHGFTFDATDCPDLFPPLVALASACEGTSVIHGAGRLKHKESDRARALASEFGKMGIAVTISGDTMEVRGGSTKEAQVDSHNDHRIAMACAVAALAGTGPVHIGNWAAVSKSYPDFFHDLGKLQEIP